jgi:hypothetical protein
MAHKHYTYTHFYYRMRYSMQNKHNHGVEIARCQSQNKWCC